MNLYRPVNIGSLELPGNLFLAPVAGYTDRSYRSICIDEGADFTFTELSSAESIIRGRPDTKPLNDPSPISVLLRRADNEKHYAIQLFGSDPERMAAGAALLARWKPDVVDINGGCPVPKVIKTGAGSALMKDPDNLGRVVEAVVRSSREHLGGVPVTIKIRSGWDSGSLNYRECARKAVEAGAAMVSLHPRTRAQGYGGRSDWSLIADLASRLPVPVTGSGDLSAPEDAERMLRETGCAAVMFARGALGNPFIFSTSRSFLSAGTYEPPDTAQRLAAGFRHLERLAAGIGEKQACLEMRKHFCAYTRGCKSSPGTRARPGMAGGARLRNQLVHAASIAEYRLMLHDVIEGVLS